MRIKRLSTLLLALAMALSLAACGQKEPTAEELLAGAGTLDPAKLTDMVVTMDVRSDAQPGDAGTGEMGMNLSGDIKLSMGIATKGDVMHVYDMKMSLGMEGMSFEIGADAWLDQAAGTGYYKMSMLGQDTGWTANDSSGGFTMAEGMDPSDVTGIFGHLVSGGTAATVMERGKKDDYTVRWTADTKSLGDMAGDAEGLPETLDCQAVFAYDGHALKSVRAAGASDGASIDVSIEFKALSADGELAIPQDVIDAAAANTGAGDIGLGSFGFGGTDTDFGGSGEDDVSTSPDGPAGTAVDTEKYKNDGDGRDEVLDPLAESLVDALPDGDEISVWHFSDHTELCLSHEGDEWSGSVEIHRYMSESDAASFLTGQKEFYSSWHETDPYFDNDTEVLYIVDGQLSMSRVLDDGVAVKADVYSYDGTENEMLSHLTELLALAGLKS